MIYCWQIHDGVKIAVMYLYNVNVHWEMKMRCVLLLLEKSNRMEGRICFGV